jgi:hypothetical protein
MRDFICVFHRLILWVLIFGFAVLALLSLTGCTSTDEAIARKAERCERLRASQVAVLNCFVMRGCYVTSDHLAQAIRDDQLGDAEGCPEASR